MNKLKQLIKSIKEEIDEMAANQGRISNTIVIADKAKADKAKQLYSASDKFSWIADMIQAIEDAGDKGLTRASLIDVLDRNQMEINPKVKSFLQIGLFGGGGLSKPKIEKTAKGPKGRPVSEKTQIARELDKKFTDDKEYKPTEDEINALGADFVEKLKKRAAGELKRGRPADPNKVKTSSTKKAVKNIMKGEDHEDIEDTLAEGEESSIWGDKNETNEQFAHMQKLAGIKEDKSDDLEDFLSNNKEEVVDILGLEFDDDIPIDPYDLYFEKSSYLPNVVNAGYKDEAIGNSFSLDKNSLIMNDAADKEIREVEIAGKKIYTVGYNV